ncbi:tetratricopeptide repeat protein [Candidatus Woesearchaeota archaeon]|nr:tetratricopeptide repeat protein [Candidatus Woesearchaeota archaeon]
MRVNKNLAIVFFLFVVVLISYINVFRNDFAWDDKFFIVDNTRIRDLGNIPSFFAEPSPGNLYRPLREAFYTLNYQLWQLNKFGYHLNSLLLHFFAALILFFITLKITNKALFSFVASLFFAAHPIHTERITNMTGTFDVFGILFFLLSFLFYINYSKKDKKNYYYFSILFYLLAIFSTEEAITLILILFLYEFSFNYEFSLDNIKLLSKKYIPYIIATIVYLMIRFSVVGQLGRTESYFQQSFFGTLLTTTKIIVLYIAMLFFPSNLVIERYVKFETSIFSAAFLFSFIILLLIIFCFIKSYKKSKILFFSIGWFFITLLPFTNLFPQVTIMAERYLYLPSFGFGLFLTILLFQIDKVKQIKKHGRIIITVSAILITLSYAALTIQRNSEWRDNFTLLTKDAEKNPYGTRIHHAIALHYRNNGDYENAFKYASRAIELSSKNYNAYENLGTILAYQKKYDEAIKFYNKALELNPKFYLAMNNLGLVYSYMGDSNTSVYYLKKAIEIDPKLSKAYNDLGTVYAQMGEFDSAIKEMEKSIEINHYNADYYYNLAVIYEYLKDKAKAAELLAKALEIEPDNKKIRNKLASIK